MTFGRRGALGLLAGGTLGAGLPRRPARAQAVGRLREDGPKPLPAFALTDPEGERREIPFFAGKGIVLNL
ncbi:MAG TPA: hypothetical protein VIL69_08045 [Roseomonas sp.]